jgi:glyoxylase-like metal-dependent hydrolase (beta-lactamase superfamily II)
LLIETDRHGLILVDTGIESCVTEPSVSDFFRILNRPQYRAEETALYQVQQLGFKQQDVRHIVLTHLDFDHAGGIVDFPAASVHLLSTELAAAREANGFIGKRRYRSQQWSGAGLRWLTYSAHDGDGWFGFKKVQMLNGLPPQILLIPLRGHTEGHAGVALKLDHGWLLHAGDAYFYHDEMNPVAPRCTPGFRFYQWMMEVDRTDRLQNQERLRRLARDHRGEVEVFCAHDPAEYHRLRENYAPASPSATVRLRSSQSAPGAN